VVKETKFFRRQADKAETAARASPDAEVSEGLIALALAFRQQAALIKKKQKQETRPTTEEGPDQARTAKAKAKSKKAKSKGAGSKGDKARTSRSKPRA